MGKRVVAVILVLAAVLSLSEVPTIKVLLSKTLSGWGGSAGYAFEEVIVKAPRGARVRAGDVEKTVVGELKLFPEDGKVVLRYKGDELKAGEIVLEPIRRELILVNAKRAYGQPSYPGKLIVKNIGGKLYVINEVDVESYIKRVIPSEMPVSFPLESLKAQAVAARSLALATISDPKDEYVKYGADCDDSAKTQVYNNAMYNETVERAVEETKGEILTYKGKPVSTLVYFSTSSGYTANPEEVWSDGAKFPGKPIPYLKSKPQFEGMEPMEVWKEEVAEKFFKTWKWPKSVIFYDSISPWFRWKVTMTRKELENIISKTLPQRERADKILKADFIQVVEGMDPSDPNFSIGKLKDLKVLKRGKGGNVMALEIVGSNGKWIVYKEFNIRFVIRPRKDFAKSEKDIVIHFHDGSTRANYSILPSAFFVMDIKRDENGEIEEVTFWGGGNGHGVGMSQYGAKFMGENGYTYDQILKKYYTDVELEKVY